MPLVRSSFWVLLEQYLEQILFRTRDNERSQQLTDSHVPDFSLEGQLSDHRLIKWQIS